MPAFDHSQIFDVYDATCCRCDFLSLARGDHRHGRRGGIAAFEAGQPGAGLQKGEGDAARSGINSRISPWAPLQSLAGNYQSEPYDEDNSPAMIATFAGTGFVVARPSRERENGSGKDVPMA